MIEIVVLILGLAALLAAILLAPAWFNARTRMAALAIIGEASAKGQGIDPAVVDRLLTRPGPKVGKGFSVFCVALGLPALGVGFGLTFGALLFAEEPIRAGVMLGGTINAAIGVGLTSLGFASLRFLAGRGQRADAARVLALICLFLGVAGLSTGIGLGSGSLAWAEAFDPGATIRTGLRLGALIVGLSGAALAVLGGFILRVFSDGDRED